MGTDYGDLKRELRQKLANIFKVPVEIFTTAKAIKNARVENLLPSGPLSGQALDHYARVWIGIDRHPGETDEELRRRCTDTLYREYEGTLVVTQEQLRAILRESLNNQKQEGEAK